ncbi:hypothetical protein [Bradyrhizobium sp.]|uniref:hypothetical protein n=1 Tax=Bradyrhizobium sp. TaxID=376 RepID=UPI001D939361|nr:hypothetical protein [Bradyrhizobium sp.]MBI5320807.1 hypothetical protein [Bradyrhizobium sp.]
MRSPIAGSTLLLAALTALGGADGAGAQSLTPFRSQAQAQRYCPDDVVVWLDFAKGIYYARGQKLYGRGFEGSFVCREEARSSGYRRSLLGLR